MKTDENLLIRTNLQQATVKDLWVIVPTTDPGSTTLVTPQLFTSKQKAESWKPKTEQERYFDGWYKVIDFETWLSEIRQSGWEEGSQNAREQLNW